MFWYFFNENTPSYLLDTLFLTKAYKNLTVFSQKKLQKFLCF